MKTPFAIGDRVRVYGGTSAHDERGAFFNGGDGKITNMKDEHGCAWVEVEIWCQTDDVFKRYWFHKKQLYRLIKKTRRSVWVGLRKHVWGDERTDTFLEALTEKPRSGFGTADGNPWVEFREVRGK